MADLNSESAVQVPRPARSSRRGGAIQALGKSGAIGIAFLLAMVFLSVAAPWITPFGPTEQDPLMRNAPPTAAHLLGTDSLGRDAFTRLLHGGRVSLSIGTAATLLGGLVGVAIGMISGYSRGSLAGLIAWTLDLLLSFPTLLIGIMVAAALGPSPTTTVTAIGVALIARFGRLSRASTLSVRRKEYVEASILIGARTPRIMFFHVLPNISAPIFGAGVAWLSHAIVAEASLSFLGLGVQPPDASWGTMIKDAMRSVTIAPWEAMVPGTAITLTAIAITLIGDRLQALLDPRLRPRH